MPGTLYIIGLGLCNESDITLSGLNAVKASHRVFLEHYTSILSIGHERLAAFYGKDVELAGREVVESESDRILDATQSGDVSFLVVGDPVCATTHTDLMIRARARGIPLKVIHNASCMGAAGSSGLHLYNFGATVSIPFFTDGWKPTSFLDKLEYNRGGGMHTLCLLDIKVKEPDFEAMKKGRTEYLPPRYMTVNQAVSQIKESLPSRSSPNAPTPLTLCVGMARLGHPDQLIVAGTLDELGATDFGGPLHCLIVCGEVHELEWEAIETYLVQDTKAVMREELYGGVK